MIALKIEDLKSCTSRLFAKDTFDEWLMREASIVTFNAFTIDGHIRQGYYTDDELEINQIEDLSAWKVIRPICFSLIKGRKLPGSFQITLQLAPQGVAEFLKAVGSGIEPDQVSGLYLNFRYEEQTLYCVTGTSLKVFTLDKHLEQEWDAYAQRYLKEQEIAFTKE
jgi:hypothetical protein